MTGPELVIWRDSVAAGDDADAPHEWILTLGADAAVDQLVRTIVSARYLASIRTGQATWIVEGAWPIAVVAQQWTEPRYLVDSAMPVREVVKPAGRPHVEVRYWMQVDPRRVFDALRAGRPLPERRND